MCIDMFWYPQQNCMACRELLVWEGTWRPTRPANKLPGWCLMSKSDCINIKQFFNWLRITLNVEHRTGKGILWAVRLHLSRPFLFFSIVWKVAARHKKQAEKCVRSPWLGSRYFHDCSCQCVKCCGKTMTVLPLPDQRLRNRSLANPDNIYQTCWAFGFHFDLKILKGAFCCLFQNQ